MALPFVFVFVSLLNAYPNPGTRLYTFILYG